MTKKEFEKEMYYRLNYLKVDDDKTLVLNHDFIIELINKFYIELSNDIKISNVKSFYTKEVKNEKTHSDDFCYIFTLDFTLCFKSGKMFDSWFTIAVNNENYDYTKNIEYIC